MEKNIPMQTDAESSMATNPSMLLLSAAVGALAGLAAVTYRFLLAQAETLSGLLRGMAATPGGAAFYVLCVLSLGALAGLITQTEPLIKGSGIPQVEAQYLGYIKPNWFSVIWKKLLAGALCIAGGLSLGREGPSIQLGAMAAQGLTEKLDRTEEEKRCLLICGACAGLAGAFNAPLAGVMFGLEEVHKRISPYALVPATVAAVTAAVVERLCYGAPSALSLPFVDMLPLDEYLLYVLSGIGFGIFAALYNKTLTVTQKLYGRINKPLWIKLLIPFGFAALAGLLLPAIQGGGHGVIVGLTEGRFTIGMITVLFIAKFLFSMLSFGSGAPGGIFFPMLVLGSLLGCLFGAAFALIFDMPEAYVVNFMLMGMAGVFAGIVRAPLTGIILVLEMSGSLTQVLGLTIVSCVAWITATMLKSKPVYESLLDHLLAGLQPEQKAQNE